MAPLHKFSVLQTLGSQNIFIAVFVIGCFAWLSCVNRYFNGEDLELFKTLLWWEFALASVLGGGLAWFFRDAIFTNMDVSVILPYISPNYLIAFCALSWLFIRLRKVLSTPVDDLVRILGLEVPTSPVASLLDISPNSVIVHWKAAEQRNSVVKYAVRVNGVVVGEVSQQENAVTISGLPAGRCYTIRIVAINSSNFQASSEAIRVKTSGNSDAESALQTHPAPSVTPCKAFPEAIAPPVAAPMTRERSGSQPQPRRVPGSRRGSPPGQTSSISSSRDRVKESETLQALNTKLDGIRSQLQELEKQDEEEEADFQSVQASLTEQRDSLKKQLKERDDESKDLNKSVKSLEHANSAAQNKKMQLERTLNEKVRAREKMQEDIARWEKEVPELEAETETLRKQKHEVLQSTETSVQAIKEEQKPDLQALVFIEEQMQERGKEMQELDNEKKRLEESPEYLEAADRNHEYAAEDREWNDRIANLQAQLNSAMAACYQAQANFAQTQQRFEMMSAQRGNQVNGFSSSFPIDNQVATADPGHVQQSSGMRVNFDLPDHRTNQMSSHNRNTTGSGNSYRTTSPFLSSGASISLPQRPHSGSGPLDVDSLTGGALTSPTAGNLLPSGLLGDDMEDSAAISSTEPREPARGERSTRSRPTSIASRRLSVNFGLGVDASNADPDFLPGLGTLPGMAAREANSPNSPAPSLGSAPQSAISSPHASLANLHSQRASDGNIESDRRSIKSASGSSRYLPGSRRFDFFGRQRGKTTSDEGPALGSLSVTQSQSVPRDSNEAAQTLTASRLPQKTAGGLFGQMSSAVLGRRAAASNANADASDATSLGRAGSSASFGSQANPWARPFTGRRTSASRPGSTYSMENALPAPSVDSPRFGWGVSRESLIRPAGQGPSNPWSPLPSRRPSIQEPSNASIREIGHAEADNDSELEDSNSPPPAPIGTKPKTVKDSDLAKQLNPNARDFTSMFSFGRKGDKGEKDSIKGKKKAKSPLADDHASSMTDDSSPPDSRKSRETLLSSTAGSFDEPRSEEPADSSPATPHDGASPSISGGRDSLMRMLSRKGSSGKFSLPSRKDKSGLFSRKANQAEDNDDDSISSAKLGRSIESITSNPLGTSDKRSSGFSLPSFKKKSKKGSEAPSISETSMTSGTGEEDEDSQSVEEEPEHTTP